MAIIYGGWGGGGGGSGEFGYDMHRKVILKYMDGKGLDVGI
jgi:hypothetical protein